MNRRFVSVLIFALVIALVASTLVYRLIEGRLANMSARPSAKVLVAARDLPVGTLISESDMKAESWSGSLPPHAIVKAPDAANRGVVANIYQGEPILETRLAPKGAGAGLAAIIPHGMRAVAVRVNDVAGVAGFVIPGMRVDVLISGLPPDGSKANLGTQTRTILQNIEVLSAGQNIQKDAEGKPVTVPVVNLLVTAEQAETLSLASSETKIQLVLRNPLDTDRAKAPGTAVAYLFEGQPAAKPQPAAAPKAPRPRPAQTAPVMERVVTPVTMEIILGTKKDTVTVGQVVVEKPKEMAR